MLNERLNLDLGLGFWGGRHFKYSEYDTPQAEMPTINAPKNFIAVDELTVGLMYIF